MTHGSETFNPATFPTGIAEREEPGEIELTLMRGAIRAVLSRWAMKASETASLLRIEDGVARALLAGLPPSKPWSEETETRARLVLEIDRALATLIRVPPVASLWLRRRTWGFAGLSPLAAMGASLAGMREMRGLLEAQVSNIGNTPFDPLWPG